MTMIENNKCIQDYLSISNYNNEIVFDGLLIDIQPHLVNVYESYVDSALDFNDDTEQYEDILHKMKSVDFTDIKSVIVFLKTIELKLHYKKRE